MQLLHAMWPLFDGNRENNIIYHCMDVRMYTFISRMPDYVSGVSILHKKIQISVTLPVYFMCMECICINLISSIKMSSIRYVTQYTLNAQCTVNLLSLCGSHETN